MLVSRRSSGEISHHGFRDLPGLLLPGDLLVVNTTATLPAQVRVSAGLAVHFSSPRPDGSWLVELRQIRDKISVPNGRGYPGQLISLPGGAVLTLEGRATARLWRARLSVAVVPYLLSYGIPIRYSYVPRDWPLPFYQTVFAREPGSAEMPSASRPFTPSVVTRLVAGGVLIAPLTLHAGVSSLEGGRGPVPRAVRRAARDGPAGQPRAGARRPDHRRGHHRGPRAGDGRAARSAVGCSGGPVAASAGWTSHVVTPETGVRAVDGLLTGLHEPRSSHLRMLAAFAGPGAAQPVLPGRDRLRVPVARVRRRAPAAALAFLG